MESMIGVRPKYRIYKRVYPAIERRYSFDDRTHVAFSLLEDFSVMVANTHDAICIEEDEDERIKDIAGGNDEAISRVDTL